MSRISFYDFVGMKDNKKLHHKFNKQQVNIKYNAINDKHES